MIRTSTNRNRLWVGAVVLAASVTLGLGGCNGKNKQEVKNPKDINGGGGGNKIPGGEKRPKRKISKDTKADFKAAVKDFEAAKARGLTGAVCARLAATFADLYKSNPKLVEAKFNEGAVYHECGQTTKAEQVYRALISKHPKFGPALNNLGVIALQRNEPSVAQSFFNRAAKAKNSEGYTNLAMAGRERALKRDTNALREAVNNIHRALAVDSFNIEAYGLLSTLVYDHAKSKSQLEIARLIAVQARKKEPKYAPVYNVLGLILLRMDEVTRALKQFRQAVQLDPKFIDAHMNIGAITLSFRDYTSAERAFKAVLTLGPKEKKVKLQATVGLGVALRGQRKYAQAMAKYKAAQAMDPSDDTIAYNRAILIQDYLFDAGNPDKAIRQLQQAQQLLKRYYASRDRRQRKDAKRRLKNIKDMIPMLREQAKMMREAQQEAKGKK